MTHLAGAGRVCVCVGCGVCVCVGGGGFACTEGACMSVHSWTHHPTMTIKCIQHATIQGPARNAIADALEQIISFWVGLYKPLGAKGNVK